MNGLFFRRFDFTLAADLSGLVLLRTGECGGAEEKRQSGNDVSMHREHLERRDDITRSGNRYSEDAAGEKATTRVGTADAVSLA